MLKLMISRMIVVFIVLVLPGILLWALERHINARDGFGHHIGYGDLILYASPFGGLMRLMAVVINTIGVIDGEFYANDDDTAVWIATHLFGQKAVDKGAKEREYRDKLMENRVRREIEVLYAFDRDK